MKKAISIEHNDRETLRQVEGLVVFSQTKATGYGSCLEISLENVEGGIWWQEQKSIPAFIKVGDRIRGFYTSSSNPIVLDSYELLDMNDNVLTRASRKGYDFIDE
jgi:hypothetical protein